MRLNPTRLALLFISMFLIAPVAIAQDRSEADRAPVPPATKTQVILLGTGNPAPNPDRSGPAVAVVVNDSTFIVDAGVGLVRRAEKAARDKGIRALRTSYLDKVFITHLHSDHTLGLADLILTPAVVGRKGSIAVYGPPGVASMTTHLLAAYEQDIQMRIDGFEKGDPKAYRVNTHEIEPGIIYDDGRTKVTAIPVKHGSWKHAFGYRFDTPDRSVVISGDTARSQDLIDAAKGCDVLVHEVYSAQTLAQRFSSDSQRYHSTFHTSGVELGKIAAEVKPGILVLYHQLWGGPKEEIVAEIRLNYDGPMAYGDDLDVF